MVAWIAVLCLALAVWLVQLAASFAPGAVERCSSYLALEPDPQTVGTEGEIWRSGSLATGESGGREWTTGVPA